jgi:hypothetical protein
MNKKGIELLYALFIEILQSGLPANMIVHKT